MKKILRFLLSSFLILFFVGFFVEVKADMTDEEINAVLSDSNISLFNLLSAEKISSLLNKVPGNAEYFGKVTVYYSVPEGKVVDKLSSFGIGGALFTLGASGNDFSAIEAEFYYFYSETRGKCYKLYDTRVLSKSGLDYLKDNGYISDTDIQNLYSDLGIVTGVSGHHFEITTNSYKGVQFKIVGGNSSVPVIYKNSGSGWEELNY